MQAAAAGVASSSSSSCSSDDLQDSDASLPAGPSAPKTRRVSQSPVSAVVPPSASTSASSLPKARTPASPRGPGSRVPGRSTGTRSLSTIAVPRPTAAVAAPKRIRLSKKTPASAPSTAAPAPQTAPLVHPRQEPKGSHAAHVPPKPQPVGSSGLPSSSATGLSATTAPSQATPGLVRSGLPNLAQTKPVQSSPGQTSAGHALPGPAGQVQDKSAEAKPVLAPSGGARRTSIAAPTDPTQPRQPSLLEQELRNPRTRPPVGNDRVIVSSSSLQELPGDLRMRAKRGDKDITIMKKS